MKMTRHPGEPEIIVGTSNSDRDGDGTRFVFFIFGLLIGFCLGLLFASHVLA